MKTWSHARFPVTCVENPAHSRTNEEFDRVRGGEGEEGVETSLYSESTILYMGLMRANASSNLVRPENFFKIDFSMKWEVFQLCVNLVKCSQDPRGRT